MTPELRLPFAISLLGGLLLGVGLVWWWLVFRLVVSNDYLTYGQAAVCIGGMTDLCTLAQALCTSGHLLGITRYSSELFWAGAGLFSAGLLLTSRRLR